MIKKLILSIILILGFSSYSSKAQVILTPTSSFVFVTPSFSASAYTASAGLWTVTSPNVITNETTTVGKTSIFIFNIQNTTVTAGGALNISLPFTCAKTTFTTVRIKDNGTNAIGVAFCVAGTSTLVFGINASAGAFAISTTATDVQGQFIVENQ